MAHVIPQILVVTSVLLSHTASGWNVTRSATWSKQTYNSLPTTDTADTTQNFIFIKSDPSESSFLVKCWITSSEQLSKTACRNGDIKVFSGESQRGLFVASFCGQHGTEVFQASSNAMYIVISPSDLAFGTSLKLEYAITKDCGTSMFGTQYQRYVRSPHYPLSYVRLQEAIYSCEWLFKAPSYHRLRMTLTYARQGYKPECRRSNVTIYAVDRGSFSTERRVVATWCGGSDNVFVSYTNYSIIRSDGQPYLDRGLRVEFIAEPVIRCFEEFRLSDGEMGTLTSPGYPSSIRELKVCRWIIRSMWYKRIIRLKVLDSDLDDSRDCTKDSVKVYNENPPFLLTTWCGTEEPAVEFYTSRLMIEYRTGADHTRTYRGIKLNFGVSQEPQLNLERLIATEERQGLQSPNYPSPFPSHQKWTWKFTSFQPIHVVKLDVQRTDVGGSKSQYCPIATLSVYEGHEEIPSKLLDTWCYNKITTIQSTGQRLMLVFTSLNTNYARKKGFVMEYWSGQYDASINVDETGSKKMSFPENRIQYVSGYNASWNFKTPESLVHDHVGVRFTNVSVACPYDAITVHDGGVGFGFRSWRFCGSSDRSYFSASQILYIRFTTQTDKGTGFDMEYDKYFYPGCGEDVEEVYTSRNTMIHLRSPGYPDNYFDRLRCKWRFISDDSSDRVRILVQSHDIVTISEDYCPTDYIRVYNGYFTSSKTFPKICGKDKSVTIESNDRYLYLEFITDDLNTGKGFKITYNSIAKDPETSSDGRSEYNPTGLIIGITVALLVVAGVVVLFVYIKRRKSRSTNENPAINSMPRFENTPMTTSDVSTRTDNVHLPPEYSEAESLAQEVKNYTSPPPTYIEAITKGMILDEEPGSRSDVTIM